MIRFSIFVPLMVAVLGGAVILGTPAAAHAGFAIRVTEFTSAGVFEASHTVTDPGGAPGDTFTATFNATNGNALPDFTVNVVTNTSSFDTNFAHHDTAINVTYKAGAPLGVGASDQLLIEVLGDNYFNPIAPAPSQITSNGSESSTNSGIRAGSITMTSGVIGGNVPLSGSPGTTLGGQMGMTTNTGSFPDNASHFFSPNPALGAIFPIANPFTFYQTYKISNVTHSGAGSLTGATEVDAITPVPPSAILALSALSILGCYGWLRRRQAVQMA